MQYKKKKNIQFHEDDEILYRLGRIHLNMRVKRDFLNPFEVSGSSPTESEVDGSSQFIHLLCLLVRGFASVRPFS